MTGDLNGICKISLFLPYYVIYSWEWHPVISKALLTLKGRELLRDLYTRRWEFGDHLEILSATQSFTAHCISHKPLFIFRVPHFNLQWLWCCEGQDLGNKIRILKINSLNVNRFNNLSMNTQLESGILGIWTQFSETRPKLLISVISNNLFNYLLFIAKGGK